MSDRERERGRERESEREGDRDFCHTCAAAPVEQVGLDKLGEGLGGWGHQHSDRRKGKKRREKCYN